MKHVLRLGAVAAALLLAAQAAFSDTKAYDLLFRDGTLDNVPRTSELQYTREVTNGLKPETSQRDTGLIAMRIDTEGSAELALLQFRQGDKKRGLGRFPASVGNPMIMYFYEATIRDMAESAGGSPFYIRNRIKDALVQPVPVETGEAEFRGETVATQIVRLHPFREDPNRDRMQGFADLELRVTMSDEVPGWYLSLEAEAGQSYSSQVTFKGVEAVE